MKPTAKEKRIFVNKPYGLFLTFPMSLKDNKKIIGLRKKHKEINIYVVFSHDLTKTSLYHWFTESGEELHELISSKSEPFKKLLIEINQIMK